MSINFIISFDLFLHKLVSLLGFILFQILVEIVSRVFPEFKFKWLVEESKKNIARELNFKEEAANTLRARFMYSHLPWLKVSYK